MQMVVKNGGTFSLNAGESVLSVLKRGILRYFPIVAGMEPAENVRCAF